MLTILDQECMSYCFCILQILYKEFPISGNPAILLCITYMTKILNKNSEQPPHDPRTIICGLDFLWESLRANESNFNFFIRHKGVYLLLDTIQVKALSLFKLNMYMQKYIFLEMQFSCKIGRTACFSWPKWRYEMHSLFSDLAG